MCNMTCLGQLGSWRDLDQRSNLEVDLSRSSCIYFDAPWQEKHDGIKYTSFLCYIKSCFRKAIFEKYHHFDINYFWSLTQWSHLKSVDKRYLGSSMAIWWFFADLFYHGFRYVNDCLSKYAKLGKIWRLVTSGPDLTSAVNRFRRTYGSSQSHQMTLFWNHGTLTTYDTPCRRYLDCRGFEITAFGEIVTCRTYGEIYLRHWQDKALVSSILTWEKYDPNSFERTSYELSNFFFRFSLRLKPPARFRASWSPPGIGLRHLGIPRYVQLIYRYLLVTY